MDNVQGSASLRKIGGTGFPVALFVLDDGTPEGHVMARLGRAGWMRIFFGKGRRVELPDGEVWRIEAAGDGPCIVPIVTCDTGKLAVATPHGKRSYGINGKDYAYNLYPTSSFGLGRPTWLLREHETELATLASQVIYAEHPVPLAAALLCFTVIKYGVPGEAALGVPAMRWG
jgi:hypothetical protein